MFCVPGGVEVSQRAYIEEIARARGHQEHARTPVTHEDAGFEVLNSDQSPTPELTLQAQGWAGEILWVSQRSRPDISFVSELISSLCTRAPERAIRVAERALFYLMDTREWVMQYIPQSSVLAGYGDISFAPSGHISHGGWLVTARSCPIAWRSSRQSLVTLSTAEAELIALQEAALAVSSIDALLQSAGIRFDERLPYSDSTSAVAIQRGSCSFRTRHSKVRASCLREQIEAGAVASALRPTH